MRLRGKEVSLGVNVADFSVELREELAQRHATPTPQEGGYHRVVVAGLALPADVRAKVRVRRGR